MNGYATARQNGWMSANDIRELENLNLIPPELGGDLYLIKESIINAYEIKTGMSRAKLSHLTIYDDAAKAASFQISHTGTYTIVGKEDTASLAHAADTEHNRSPILLLIPACLLLLSAGEFFLRRRRK